MTTYHLAEHIHSCLTNGHIVFLDLKKDRYSALPPELSTSLSLLATQRTIDTQQFEQNHPGIQSAIANLKARGILQSIVPKPTCARPRSITKPRRDLSEANIEGHRSIPFIHIVNFIYAYGRAVFGIKILGIERLVRSLSRHRHSSTTTKKQRYTLEEVVDTLRLIRIFFYKEIDHCYFDCVVHMYFLRRYGYDPVWIFGVRMEPFRAHSWIQVGDVLVTNYLGETGMLRPILAV